jgi:hypothetical protein
MDELQQHKVGLVALVELQAWQEKNISMFMHVLLFIDIEQC